MPIGKEPELLAAPGAMLLKREYCDADQSNALRGWKERNEEIAGHSFKLGQGAEGGSDGAAAGDDLEIGIFDLQRDSAPAQALAHAMTPDLGYERRDSGACGLKIENIGREGDFGTNGFARPGSTTGRSSIPRDIR